MLIQIEIEVFYYLSYSLKDIALKNKIPIVNFCDFGHVQVRWCSDIGIIKWKVGKNLEWFYQNRSSTSLVIPPLALQVVGVFQKHESLVLSWSKILTKHVAKGVLNQTYEKFMVPL